MIIESYLYQVTLSTQFLSIIAQLFPLIFNISIIPKYAFHHLHQILIISILISLIMTILVWVMDEVILLLCSLGFSYIYIYLFILYIYTVYYISHKWISISVRIRLSLLLTILIHLTDLLAICIRIVIGCSLRI